MNCHILKTTQNSIENGVLDNGNFPHELRVILGGLRRLRAKFEGPEWVVVGLVCLARSQPCQKIYVGGGIFLSFWRADHTRKR